MTFQQNQHHKAIAHEKALTKYLDDGAARSLWPKLSENYTAKHIGGTKHKEDIVIKDGDNTIKISVKKKKKLSAGSFDYINSTSAVTEGNFPGLKEKIKLNRETFHESKHDGDPPADLAKIQTIIACNTALRGLSSEQLEKILMEQVAKPNEKMHMMVSDKETGKNWQYKFKDTPLYNSVINHKPVIIYNNAGLDSKPVMFIDDKGNVHDHNILIRVTLNNGNGALIGISKANKNSQPSFKVQQNKIEELIPKLVKAGIAREF